MSSQQVKLVLLGDTGVGKTSIVQRFVYNNYREENPPTIGASFMSKVMEIPGTEQTIKFQIWDTAGQEKYKSLASMYYKDASAAILVYDITSKQSFEAIKFWVKELKENVQDELVIAIAANKADLIEQENVELSVAQKYSSEIDAIFKQTSAKDNIGIDDVFLKICMNLRPDLADKIQNANKTAAHAATVASQGSGSVSPKKSGVGKKKGKKGKGVKLNAKKNKKKQGCC